MSKDINEKQALFPRLRFPAFRKAGSWTRLPLGQIAFILNEKAGNKKLTLLSITSGVGLVSQIEKFGREIAGAQYKNYYVIYRDDFAYNKSSTKDFPEGFIARYQGDEDGAVPNSIFTCFRVRTGLSYPPFLSYLFENNIHGKWLRRFITIGARAHGSLNVDDKDLLATPVPVPPKACLLKEQKKISDCLSSLDQLITAETQKLDALNTHKKALMQQLFPYGGEAVPRLRFPEFRGAEEWESKPFEKFVVRSFYGTSSSTSETGQYPVLRMGNMIDGGLDFSNLAYIDLDSDSYEKIRLTRGDILMNRTNSLDLVGKISLFDRDIECITASYIVTFRLDKRQIIPEFCNLMLNTQQYQRKIRALARPSVSQANINPTAFRTELIVLVPKIAEQQRIVSCLTPLDDLITAQRQKIDSLKVHKKGLMQQLFPVLNEAHP